MKKIGLCLSGGGARGAYQIGAVKALQELEIFNQIKYFSGTSIGAVNAAVLATNTIEHAKDIWFNIPDEALVSNGNFLKRLTKEKFEAFDKGIYKMDSLEEILINNVNLDRIKNKDVYITISDGGDINQSIFDLIKSTYKHYFKKEEKAVYLNLKDLNREDSYKAILASCAIPFIFPSINYNNKKYYDGGVFDNVPIRPLVDAGCDEIIVIHLAYYFDRTKKYSKVKFHHIKHNRSWGLGRILDFTSEHSKKIYDYGYKDTLEYFEGINS